MYIFVHPGKWLLSVDSIRIQSFGSPAGVLFGLFPLRFGLVHVERLLREIRAIRRRTQPEAMEHRLRAFDGGRFYSEKGRLLEASMEQR